MTSANQAWLDQVVEAALEPELPICDSHHHLWDVKYPGVQVQERYLLDDLLADLEMKGELVRALVAVLRPLVERLGELSRRLEREVAALPDGRIIMSFPRAGRVCAAQILAELGDVRERYLSADHLAAEAGACPVTHASGKSRGVKFRWACNHRLRRAITTFADNSRHESQWAQDIYLAAKKRGCRHAHAIRILARAWIRVIWRAWTDGKPYDPQKHRTAMRATEIG